LDFRRFGGTQHHRTAYAGATTGQQLLYALDEQVRRFEVEGLVTKYEGWEFLGAVIDEEGIGRGIVAQNIRNHEIKSFPSDATILATGGPGIIFGKSTNSIINTGDRKSTRLNSSHVSISYAVFCLKKKRRGATAPTQSRATRHT